MGQKPDLKPRKQRGATIVGGIPDPIMISERVAVDLFADTGMTRNLLRRLIDNGEIIRRERTVNGRKITGLIYQELVIWAMAQRALSPEE